MTTAIEVRGLRVRTAARPGRPDPAGTELVRGVDLAVRRGEALGVVGESGSGKSLTLRAIMGLLPDGVARAGGEVRVLGRLGMMFQDPLSALDPLMPVGAQVAAVARIVRGMSRARARERALELFRQVGLPDPERRLLAYPHQLSGGQRQRVVLAIALAAEPDILLCDEPTTALDVTVQAQVLALLDRLRRELGLTLVFVSHDLAVVAQLCERIVVMRHGEVVERGDTAAVLAAPQHPYTRELLAAVLELPEPSAAPAPAPRPAPAGPPRLEVRGVTVRYGGHPAVRDAGFAVPPGGALGIVGESGSGKTTLARVIAGQVAPAAGGVLLDGRPLGRRRSRAERRDIQVVFQDPFASLNPRRTVRSVLAELLRAHRLVPRGGVEARCRELMRLVELPESALDAVPGQFSGGQRQRIAIARALAVEPRVLVADEPTSALDVSVQRTILALLDRLRAELGLTIVFISHDLAVVHELCEDVIAMRSGEIVEHAPAAAFFSHPQHPYSRALLAAAPRLPAPPAPIEGPR